MFKRQGAAVETLKKLGHSSQLKRSRIDVRSAKREGLDKIVIGIGQIHPVMRGRFARFEAQRIGRVQAWIFELCSYFYSASSVHSFGQEGFSSATDEVMHARLSETMLKKLRSKIDQHSEVDTFFKHAAKEWRAALRSQDKKKKSETVSALNGLALLQAMESDVSIFPIEQQAVHGAIGQNIDRLQKEIGALEHTSAFASYKKKAGKGLTKDEYDIAMQRNALIKEFNKMIKHPSRDKSILREILKHADTPMTVFVLGQGHRHAFLRLAKSHIPDDTLFVWITPPSLWWWKSMRNRFMWVLLTSILLYFGVYYWLLSLH